MMHAVTDVVSSACTLKFSINHYTDSLSMADIIRNFILIILVFLPGKSLSLNNNFICILVNSNYHFFALA